MPQAKTDANHPHYGDPEYTEEFYTDYTKEVKDFFTLRTMWWGYYHMGGQRFVGTEDNWSFGYDLGDERVKAMMPDDLVSKHNGIKEEAAVTPAQHPSSLIGKSWTREHGEPQLDQYDLPVSDAMCRGWARPSTPRGLRDLFPAAVGRGDPGQPAVPVHQRLERMDGGQVSARRRKHTSPSCAATARTSLSTSTTPSSIAASSR